jgi:hypothetical protein
MSNFELADSTAFQIGDVLPDDESDNNYMLRKKTITKKSLNEAYAAYLNSGPHLSTHPQTWLHLMNLTREFLYNKIWGLENDPGFKSVGTSQTVEDWVQDAWLSISEAIDRGNITNYSAYVNRAAFTRRASGKKYLCKQRKTKVSLEKELNESGDIVDNLEVFRSPIFRENIPTFGTIPRNLTHLELDLLKMFTSEHSLKIAAETLDIPLSTAYTVAKRIAEKRVAEDDARKVRVAKDDAAKREREMARIALQKTRVRTLVMLDGDDEKEVA